MSLLDEFKSGLGTVLNTGADLVKTKLQNDALAKQTSAETKRLQATAQMQQATPAANSMPKWLIPAGAGVAALVLVAVLFRRK